MPQEVIFTTSAMKSMFRARWAYFCAVPHSDRYKHLYEIYKMLIADEKINDLPQKYGAARAKEIQEQLLKLEYTWIEVDRLEQHLDTLYKKNTKMEPGQDRSPPDNQLVRELRKEIRHISYQMPPLFHILIEVLVHLMGRTDLVNYAPNQQMLEFARGDKLPFKVDVDMAERK